MISLETLFTIVKPKVVALYMVLALLGCLLFISLDVPRPWMLDATFILSVVLVGMYIESVIVISWRELSERNRIIHRINRLLSCEKEMVDQYKSRYDTLSLDFKDPAVSRLLSEGILFPVTPIPNVDYGDKIPVGINLVAWDCYTHKRRYWLWTTFQLGCAFLLAIIVMLLAWYTIHTITIVKKEHREHVAKTKTAPTGNSMYLDCK